MHDGSLCFPNQIAQIELKSGRSTEAAKRETSNQLAWVGWGWDSRGSFATLTAIRRASPRMSRFIVFRRLCLLKTLYARRITAALVTGLSLAELRRFEGYEGAK
jgi:hypothetical protein